jgi:hypothetical protein
MSLNIIYQEPPQLSIVDGRVIATLTVGELVGPQGKSAYQVAVDNGFVGSESQWLASLVGENGETPEIGENGNWFIGGVDTGLPSRGIQGEQGDIPYIQDGNWFVGGVDTGIQAQGPAGEGFDGLNVTDGNIPRANGTTYEPINEIISPLAYYSYGQSSPGRIWAADNFEVRGNSPSNELVANRPYENVTIEGNIAKMLDVSFLAANANARNFRMYSAYQTRVSTDLIYLCLYRDSDNYILIEFGPRFILNVNQILGGVKSNLLQRILTSAPERFIFNNQVWWDNRDLAINIIDSNGVPLRINQSAIPNNGSLNKIGYLIVSPTSNSASILNYRWELK